MEPRQHRPEGERRNDGDAGDRSEPSDWAQIISDESAPGSGLKFSSSRTQVMQRISRRTISEGLKGANFRVAETKCRAIEACAGVAARSTSCRSSCSQEKLGMISSRLS